MRINSLGNVGIGTTNPGKKLDVNGEARITTGLTITPATSTVYATDSTLSSYATGNGVYLNGHANGWLRLNGSGANRASIDVWGENYAAPFADAITFRTGGTAERMMIASNGNVGIGTTSPDGQLEILNNTAQNQTSSQTFSKGAGTKSLILTKRHNSTKDSLVGYFGPMMDFRMTNVTNTWSNGHIIGVGDPDGSSNHAGGLAFYTNPGGATGSNVNGVNAGGTNHAAMLMTHDAQIKQPRQVAFFARPPTNYGTTDNVIIGSTWSVTNQGGPGTGSQFSTSGIFTVPSTGWYVIHWTCLVGAVSDSRLDFYLTKNDTEIARSEINGYSTTSFNRSGAVTGVFYLTKSDYIKFGIRGDAGSSTYSQNTPWGYASGYFLG
jgi:hypothetical protein